MLFCFVGFFFSPFRIAITSLGEERANLSAFPTFVSFALVFFFFFFFFFFLFPLPFGVWEGLRLVIVAHPGLFSYFFVALSLSVPNFRQHLSSAFLFLTNYRLKRSLYVKLTD